MKCPECRTRMNIVDSRSIADTVSRRRHKCPKCGKSFTAVEAIVPDIQWGEISRQGDGWVFINLETLFSKIAKNAVVKGQAMSLLTGNLYGSFDDAYEDTLNELKRLSEGGK